MQEMWKDLAGYEEKYEVSNMGYLRNKKSGKILNGSVNADGWVTVTVRDGPQKQRYMHKVVSETFLGAAEGRRASHKDGNKLNNRSDNLVYVAVESAKHPNHRNVGKPEIQKKPIRATNLESGKTVLFSSLEAVKRMHLNFVKVFLCITGMRKEYAGRRWEYVEEGSL